MKPIRPDDGSKITEEDLIGLSLRELTPAHEAIVRRALAQDAALAADSAAIAATLAAIEPQPVRIDTVMVERNWRALRSSLAVYPKALPGVPAWRWPAFAGLALAGAATIAYVALNGHAAGRPEPGPTAAAPAPAGGSPGLNAIEVPGLASAPSQLKSNDGFKVRFGGGVYHPRTGHPDSAIRMLPLATNGAGTGKNPGPMSPQDGSRPGLPLTETPAPLVAQALQAGPLTAMQQDSSSSGSAVSGTEKPSPGHGGGKLHTPLTTDLMLGVGGNFIASRHTLIGGTEAASMSATHSIVALASVHQQFRTALGYRVTTSYTRPDFAYDNGGSTGGMNSRIFELAVTYVIAGPHHKRLTTTGDLGGAVLLFVPQVQSSAGNRLLRPAGVLGVNADFALTKHLGVRLGYRAQLFRTPDFYDVAGAVVTTPITVSSEPSLGVVYRFGK